VGARPRASSSTIPLPGRSTRTAPSAPTRTAISSSPWQPARSTSSTRTSSRRCSTGSFSEPGIPAGFAPFGIANTDNSLFETYAKQNAQKNDVVAGAGLGFVDAFTTDGVLVRRFASRGVLNAPWGVARATQHFGPFSGDILIGNFGSTGKCIDPTGELPRPCTN
jgi:uncharacterized protein (TIGR03118 family)